MIGYAPQQISSFNIGFPRQILKFVESGRYQNNHWFRRLDAEDLEYVRKALEHPGKQSGFPLTPGV